MQITNAFDASRLFLNPMIPEVTNLTERFYSVMIYTLFLSYISIFKFFLFFFPILMHLRLTKDDLSVSLVEKSTGKKDGKRILYNWNDAEIKTISEILEGNQVH